MSETPVTAETLRLVMKDGDVYEFQYSAAYREKQSGPGLDLSWCFDGQLVYRNGKLCDTYWSFGDGVDGRVFTVDQAIGSGTLRFICNLNDVRIVPEYEQQYYDDNDCFNLSYQHGCYKKFAIRKDAAKSAVKMLNEINDRIRKRRADASSAVTSALADIERLSSARTQIEAGNLDVRF